MVDTVFVDKQTLVPAAWLNDVNNIAYGLPASTDTKGSGLVYFDPTLNYTVQSIGAAVRDSEWSLFWFPAVRSAVAAGTDCTSAVQAVVSLKIAAGGGSLYAPRAPTGGAWLFNGGGAQPDGYKNGILMPFTTVNPDPSKSLKIRGEKGVTFKCGSNNMILIRRSGNFGCIEDLVLDSNGKTGCILDGVVPEDMTQTTTLASQQFMVAERIYYTVGPGNTGRWIQPGPRVTGSDSGCFYMLWRSCTSNSPGGGRHVRSDKGSTWAIDGNRLTRSWFEKDTQLRGNVGYDLVVGSEISIDGHEELIADGVTPLATPTARNIGPLCSNIVFMNGYSESCTESFVCSTAGIVSSYAYVPASGGTTDFRANVKCYGDGGVNIRTFTPVLNSSGGGAQGAATSDGDCERIGNTVFGRITISAAKGTLAAGSLTISGLPYQAKTGKQYPINVAEWDSVTLIAPNNSVGGFISGATLSLRKTRVDGGGATSLTVAEIGATVFINISFQFQVS